MGFLNNLGLVLLTMVGYSIGRVLVARKYKVAAELFDGVIIVALWICASVLQASGKTHSLWLWIGIGFLSGLIVTFLAHTSLLPDNQKQIYGDKEKYFQKIWNEWKSFAFRMGNFQGRMILLLFYFTILMPFGIMNRFFRDPLNIKKTREPTRWYALKTSDNEIESARRQF